MNLEQTKAKLKKLISEVNSDNSGEYYDKIGEVVKKYRDSGGFGKPIQDFLSELNKEFGDVDRWKEEHIIDIGNRIVGFAPPFRRIDFPDFEKEK